MKRNSTGEETLIYLGIIAGIVVLVIVVRWIIAYQVRRIKHKPAEFPKVIKPTKLQQDNVYPVNPPSPSGINQVFVSYNRKDSTFALSLSKDLASNGIDVWIDQLSIPPGAAWDRAIEKALISSPLVLVVLSKTSVESDNVLDEISFAFQKGKRIIPVLSEECNVPMRLARLQQIDFTGNYQNGYTKLLDALNKATGSA